MKRTNKLLTGMAAGLFLAISVPANAQPGEGMGSGTGPCMSGGKSGAMGQGKGGMHGKRGMMGDNPAAMTEGHLAYLKTVLKITPQQDTAWQAFATKSRKLAETMQAKRSKMQEAAAAPLSAPDRLAQQTEFMKQKISDMEIMTTAVSELYTALTPEQKTLADKHFSMRGRHHKFSAQQAK